MNDLKIFSNSEFGELGVMLIDGKEYFPATRCAKILGYKEPEKAIREKCKGVSKIDTPTAGGIQAVNYIPEGDLYRLIVSSKLPGAEKFERWVFDEVLPSIRKSGGYGAIDVEKIITATATAVASEIMKQFIPMVMGSTVTAPAVWEEPLPKEKKRRKPVGIIWKLSPEIRGTVNEMLRANMSYKDVQTYLNLNGIGISQAALCNYYNSVINGEEK